MCFGLVVALLAHVALTGVRADQQTGEPCLFSLPSYVSPSARGFWPSAQVRTSQTFCKCLLFRFNLKNLFLTPSGCCYILTCSKNQTSLWCEQRVAAPWPFGFLCDSE